MIVGTRHRTANVSIEVLEARLPLAAELLIDLNPTNLGLNPKEFTTYAGETYFTSNAGEIYNAELWKTDGTDLGTKFVTSVGPGEITDMAVVDDKLAILVDRPISVGHSTYEIVAYDHVSKSVRTLATKLEGDNPYSDGTSGFLVGKSRGYFLSDTFPFEPLRDIGSVFVTDGDSATNARLVHSTCVALTQGGTDSCEHNRDLVVVGDVLYYSTKAFSSGDPRGAPDDPVDVFLWAYDGISSPRVVRTLASGIKYGTRQLAGDFTRIGESLYFTAPIDSGDRTLWVSDGTNAGTRPIESPRVGFLLTAVGDMTAQADRLYFTADVDAKRQLWITDSRGGTPKLVSGLSVDGKHEFISSRDGLIQIFNSGELREIRLVQDDSDFRKVGEVPQNYQFVAAHGGDLLFSVQDADGTALHKVDVQLGRTRQLGVVAGRVSELFATDGGSLLFRAGSDLWVFNSGIVKQVQMPSRSGSVSALGDFFGPVLIDGDPSGSAVLGFRKGIHAINYFMEPEPIRLLVTDGTKAGTFDIGETFTYGVGNAIQVEGKIYVPGSDWIKIDVATKGVSVSLPDELFAADSRYDLSTRQWEPAPLTFEGRTLEPPRISYEGNGYVAIETTHGRYAVVGHRLDDRTFVRQFPNGAFEQAFDAELLDSLDIEIVFSRALTNGIFDGQSIGDLLFFVARDKTHGSELWQSDGTVTGTRLVRDIYPGPRDSDIELLGVSSNTLYFLADDGVHGREIWTLSTSLPGDVDDNGAVDLQDFLILASNFGKPTERGRKAGDLNESGKIDFLDFLIVAKNYGLAGV